jgi:hypothetical protein
MINVYFKIDPKIDFKGIGFPLWDFGRKVQYIIFSHAFPPSTILIHVPAIEVMWQLRPLYYNHPNLNGCPQVKAVGHIHFIKCALMELRKGKRTFMNCKRL